jgi:hypothetical protein
MHRNQDLSISGKLLVPGGVLASEPYAHLDRSNLPTTNRRSLRAWLRRWYHVSELRLLVKELRSLPYRMARSCEIREEELRGCTGLGHTESASIQSPPFRNRRHAYIHHMQQLHAVHPWMTIVDLLLVEEAWKAGSEWRDHMDRWRNQINRSSVRPEGSNSIPPQVVQQSTTRDPLTPLPSQG